MTRQTRKAAFTFKPGLTVEALAAKYQTTEQWIVRGLIEANISAFILSDSLLLAETENKKSLGKWIRIDDRSELRNYAYNGNFRGRYSSFKKGTDEDGVAINFPRAQPFRPNLFWCKTYISFDDIEVFQKWVAAINLAASTGAVIEAPEKVKIESETIHGAREASTGHLASRGLSRAVVTSNRLARDHAIRALAQDLMREEVRFRRGDGRPAKSELKRKILSLAARKNSRTTDFGNLTEAIVRKALEPLRATREY